MSKLFPVVGRFIAAPLMATALLGCSRNDNPEPQTATQVEVTNEAIRDTVPDKHGVFLNVDDVLKKTELGKVVGAKLWIDAKKAAVPYYEFALSDGSKVYAIRPKEEKEVGRLENGLRTVGTEPIYVTRGTEGSTGKIIDYATTIIPSALVATILIGCLVYYGRMVRGGKDGLKPVKPKERFPDVRGYPKIVGRLEQVVKYIKDKDKNKVGAELPKGILLTGPPGTGKTLLARATAGEANVPFIPVDVAGLIQMIGGVGVLKLKTAFNVAKQMAKKHGGCIMFFDEIDAVGAKRSNAVDGVTQERIRILTCLLTEMDGFKQNSGIVHMAATNRPDILDPALIRAGRFEMTIDIPPPISSSQRKDILDKYLSIKREKGLLALDVNIKTLADNTKGFVGADLEGMVKRATLIAFENGQDQITMKNFTEAIVEIKLGMESGSMTESDLWKTGIHEIGGHAQVGRWLTDVGLLRNKDLVLVSMIPRGKVLGHAGFSGSGEILPGRNRLLQDLIILLAGRAAEMELLPPNEYTLGAEGDYKEARKMIRQMLSSAMFKGHVSSDYSDSAAELSDKDDAFVTKVLDRALEIAKRIVLRRPKDKVEELIRTCIEKGEIQGPEIITIFNEFVGVSDSDCTLVADVQDFINNPTGEESLKEEESVLQCA